VDETDTGAVGKGVWKVEGKYQSSETRNGEEQNFFPIPGFVFRDGMLFYIFIQPIADCFQCLRSNGFFQLPVFGHRAFVASLKEVVQPL
jgi:hypothetical protein